MRVAADELRAELAGETATFVVNRNVNFTNVCVVGCAFCGFGQGKRSPDAYHVERGRLPGADRRGGRVRRDRDLHAGRDPPRLHARALRPLAAARQGGRAAASPARLLADGDPLHVRALGPLARRRSSTTCSSAGSARPRAPPPRCSTTASARGSRRTSCRPARWVEIIEACHRSGPALDLDRDVRPHRGAVGARRATCASSASCRSAPAGSPSSCRSASSRSRRCSAAPTGSRRSRARRTSSTPPPSGSRSGSTITNLQASWVKMGLDAATESLRWGVNDLGGTLMEENISRMAGSQHGVRLEPERPDRARPRRAAAPRPSARRSTRSSRPTEPTMRAMVLERPGVAARRSRGRRIPSPAPARSLVAGARLRRLPHRPAHRRRRARRSRSCRSSSATRSSARWSPRARARALRGRRPGRRSRGSAGPAASAATAARGARTSASGRASPATRSTAATPSSRSPTSASASRCPDAAGAETRAAAVRRADRLPGPADVRRRRAPRPLRVRRLGAHRLPGRGARGPAGVRDHPRRRRRRSRRSRASSAPSGRAPPTRCPSRSTRRSSSRRPASSSRPRCGRSPRAAASSAPAST